MDPGSLTTALTSLKSATTILKGVIAADASLKNAELKMQIAELATALVDARTAILEAQEEMHGLRAQIAELRHAEEISEALTLRENVYWQPKASGEDGPFCTRCFDSEKKLIRVHMQPPEFQDFGKRRCPECKQSY
jgi:hypothetical protein